MFCKFKDTTINMIDDEKMFSKDDEMYVLVNLQTINDHQLVKM